MGKRPFGLQSRWDIPAAVAAVLLFANFLVVLALLLAAMGMLFFYGFFPMATALLLLAGILCHFITRKRSCKLWRRLLLGGIASNILIAALYVLAMVLFTLAWLS